MSPPAKSARVTTPEFSLGYRPELDGVRGISILLVMGLHFAPRFFPGGYFGVDIFFALSGFLITSLLLQEWSAKNSIRLKDFYIRRALRLGPALGVYLLALGGYAFLILSKPSAHEVFTGILWTLSYVSNWVMALKPNQPQSILAITWSLAVEEQFYLIWPPLLAALLAAKLRRRSVLIALALSVLFEAVYRALLWHSGAPPRRLYYGTDTHADGLMLGCLLACLISWGRLPQSKMLARIVNFLALISIVFVGYLVATTHSNKPILYWWGFSLASLAIATMLLALLQYPAGRALTMLRLAPLVWIGRVSYGLYLWHWPVRGLVFGKSVQPSLKQIVGAIALSFIVTAISFYVVEQPFLRWKKRFSHA